MDGDSRSDPPGLGLGFRIRGEHDIYFAGDTNLYPEMAELAGDLELALIPVGGWDHCAAGTWTRPAPRRP